MKKGLMASRVNMLDNNLNEDPKNTKTSTNQSTEIVSKKEKKPKRNKKQKKEKTFYTVKETKASSKSNDFNHADFDEEITYKDELTELRKETAKNISKKLIVVIQIIIAVLSVYVCFLIFGLMQTSYRYDDSGEVKPLVFSVEDLSILNEYETLTNYYLRARAIYEKTLELDFNLSVNPDNSLLIAMEYTELLSVVDKLAVDLRAAEYNLKYTGLYNQIANWTATDIAVYLQKISTAITNDDASSASDAVIARSIVYNDFAQLTSNIAAIAANTKGVSNINLYTWTPESYIESLQGGEH